MDERDGSHPGVTLRDIARKMGLSHVTVSLALRDHPKIPVARRLQIQRVARELGYLPNASAVALSHHKRGVKDQATRPSLLWLKLWEKPSGKDCWHEELRSYWREASAEAERLGYQLEEFVPHPSTAGERLARLITGLHANGILLPSSSDAADLERLGFPFIGLPVVCLERFMAASGISSVAADDLQNAATAFGQIWSRGYRRVGLVLERRSLRGKFAWAGFLHACSQQEGAVPPLELSEINTRKGQAACAAWFQRHQPDALLLEHANQLKLLETTVRLPALLAVAFLDVPEGVLTEQAGIRRNTGEIDRAAVQALVSQINIRPAFPGFVITCSSKGRGWTVGRCQPTAEQ